MKNKLPVDPWFDLENCVYTLDSILECLEINQAYFISDDRGCIIMDNMHAELPELDIERPENVAKACLDFILDYS